MSRSAPLLGESFAQHRCRRRQSMNCDVYSHRMGRGHIRTAENGAAKDRRIEGGHCQSRDTCMRSIHARELVVVTPSRIEWVRHVVIRQSQQSLQLVLSQNGDRQHSNLWQTGYPLYGSLRVAGS